MIVIALITGAFATQNCASKFSQIEIRPFADGVVASFVQVDDQHMARFYDELMSRLPCSSERLDAATIGQIHLAEAIHAVASEELSGVGPAVAGLLAALPGYQFSPASFPNGHPILTSIPYAQNLILDTESELVPDFNGIIEVDGRPQQDMPQARNRLIQVFGPEQQIIATRYARAHEDVLPWLKAELSDWEANLTLAVPLGAGLHVAGVLQHAGHPALVEELPTQSAPATGAQGTEVSGDVAATPVSEEMVGLTNPSGAISEGTKSPAGTESPLVETGIAGTGSAGTGLVIVSYRRNIPPEVSWKLSLGALAASAVACTGWLTWQSWEGKKDYLSYYHDPASANRDAWRMANGYGLGAIATGLAATGLTVAVAVPW